MKDEVDLAAVIAKLRWLRLPGMSRAVEAIVERARKENLTPLQIADALCEEEKNSRIKSAVERRVRGARFAEINRWMVSISTGIHRGRSFVRNTSRCTT